MALRKRPIATCIATLLFSGYVSALGLGEIKLNSALNEPLDAEVPLLNMAELSQDDIIAGLASNADFSNAGVDKEIILTTLEFKLDMNAAGGPALRITSKRPIREPYLDFLVDVQWPAGRLLREYTLLLDLPVYAGGDTSKKKIEQPVVQSRPSSRTQQAASPRSTQQRSSSPATVVAGDEEYFVQRGDTLWGIARRMNSDASMQQRMEAIFQVNPDAFINGDMNLLKAGEVLRLPDYGSLNAQLSGRGSYSRSNEPQYSPELSAAAREGRAREAINTGGRLTLEAGGDGVGGSSSLGSGAGELSGLRGEMEMLQDELEKSNRENTGLRQRLASLEEQIATMERLLEVGDDDLRAIQLAGTADDALSDTGDSLTDDSIEGDLEIRSPALALFPSANTSGGERPSLGSDRSPMPPQLDGSGLEEDFSAESGDVLQAESDVDMVDGDVGEAVDTDPNEVAEEKQEAAATASLNTELKTEKGWFDQVNGFLIALLGVVVLIGAGAVYFLRKRRESEEEYQPPAETHVPPPSQVRERPREEPPEPEPQATSIEDIDLKEGDDLFAETEEEAIAEAPTRAEEPESLDDVELDLSEFDLEGAEENKEDLVFEESDNGAPVASAEELNLDEEFDFLGDIDEGDTQLELAQAYIEMGDQAGAKEILQEVAESGSEEQKSQAQQLLGKLG